MQQLAPRPSQSARPIPYGLVSLWDMINFNLQSFMWTLLLIRQEAGLAAMKASKDPTATMSPSDLERFRNSFTGIAESLNALFIAEGRVGRLATMARLNAPYADVAHELVALDSDIHDAAMMERFYHYPRDKGVLLLRIPGDWAAALRAFPLAQQDIESAVDCFAIGHNNASIYHCMMILERGLPAFAKRLKVTFIKQRPTWKDMIDDIRKKIDDRRRAAASQPRGGRSLVGRAARNEHKFLGLCGEAALEFRFFEHAWRNHIAHGRADYDENDAKKVLEHVRTFMEVIVTKLKLKEKS